MERRHNPIAPAIAATHPAPTEPGTSSRVRSALGLILMGLILFVLTVMTSAPVEAQPLSDDNTLRSLRVAWGSDTYSMSPAFNRFRNDYVVVVPADRTEVLVTPVKNHHGATGPHVTPGDNDGTGSYTVDLSPGSNIVHISLSAELGHFRRYSVNVFRGGSLPTATLPSGALLSSLRLTGGAEVIELPGEEVEGEDCGCATYYRMVVPKRVSRLGLFATVRSGARVETQFRTGSRRSGATRNVSLREGRNELIVSVYRTGNQGGRALEVYRLLIIRAGDPPKIKDATVTREGNVLLRYDRTLLPDVPDQRRTPGSAFEVTVNGTRVNVTHTAVTQKWLHLTLARAAGPDAQVRVRYRVPSSNPVQSAKFGLAASFSNKVARYAGSGLLVFDATAEEAPGASVDFKVMLLPKPVTRVSVDYETSDDTATAGSDYTATSGTLIFEVGEIHKRISVPVIDDDVEDNGETFKLTLSNPINAFLGDATATGTIHNHDPEDLTASFGGAPATHGGDPFALLLEFTEPVGVGWGTMNEQLLGVTNGRVSQARRVDRERDPQSDKVFTALWEIAIEPSGGDVTVEVPATADCEASLPVCTRDGRPLSAEASVTIPQGVGLQAATANADSVALTFEEALDEASVPAASAFTVRVGGETRSLATNDPVRVSGSTVTLTLASPAADRETVTVDYAVPSVNRLRNLAGVPASALYGQSVLNDTPDTTAPRLLEAAARWDAVVLTWDEALDEASVPATSAFTVRVGGEARSLAARGPVRVSGSTVTLKFGSPAAVGDTVTVDYAVPSVSPLRDLAGVSAEAATVETVVPDVAFTVRFEEGSVPETHDGVNRVAFRIVFSEEPAKPQGRWVSEVVRDAVVARIGGDRIHPRDVEKLDDASRRRWQMKVRFQGGFALATGDLTIELGPTVDCDDQNALCTGDRRPLSNRISKRIRYAPSLSVAGANATEAADATIDFTVTLSRAQDVPVRVDYATTDDTATSGEDYTSASGTLTFEPGETDKTVSVPVLDDGDSEGLETLTLTLSNASGAGSVIRVVDAEGTIEDDEPPLEESGDPVTAEIRDVSVAAHDGSASFTFELRFSEDITGLSYASLRDHAFTVTNGEVTRVRRLDPDGEEPNREWKITVEPDGDADVIIELPATTDCGDPGAVCMGNRPLSAAVSATVPGPASEAEQQDAGDSLTAEFRSLPTRHDGSASFTFELRFSEDIAGLSYATLRDHAFTVTNGQVTGASRLLEGKNQRWEVAVEPNGNADVTIKLPATTDCGDPGAICIGTRPLSASVSATVPGPAPETENPSPLTAAFRGLPASHDGRTAFAFELRFSENWTAGLSYVSLRDHAFTVTNGEVTGVRRLKQGRNQRWEITVEQDGNADVTIELPATTDCGDTGAICIPDGRMLSNTVSTKILGPPGLSVGNAQVVEAAGATLDFTVTMSRALSETVTVDYATSDGSAQEGSDYTSASGTLTFVAGDTLKTVPVPVLEDALNEGEETFTLTLSNPSGGNAYLADSQATGTIENSDPMPRAWLARFGRTVGSQAVDAIGSRMEGGGGTHVTVGGQALPLSGGSRTPAEREDVKSALMALGESGGDGPGAATRARTGRELLLGSSFRLSAGGAAAFTAWGRVAEGRFEAGVDGVRLDGSVTSGFLGVDVGRERWLAGVALSLSEGEGDYALMDGEDAGEVESSLTAFYPYARFSLSERLDAWGLAGWGEGELTLTQQANADRAHDRSYNTDISMRMGAVGARGEVLSPDGPGGVAVAVKTDALWVRTSSEAVGAGDGNLAASEADVTRLRLLVEGSRGFEAGGGTLTPSVELGVRHDGGDAETGTGIEAARGFATRARASASRAR